MHFVYILYSEGHNKFYIGETSNPDVRFNQHNAGKVLSTKAYIPWQRVWLGEKATRKEALILEKKLKNLGGHERIRAFIQKYGT